MKLSASTFFTLMFCFICFETSAQCSWVRGASESLDYNTDVWSVVSDSADNYYVAGAFRADFSADGVSFTAPTKGQGYFVAKYDTDGNIIWGKVIEAFAESNTRLPRIHNMGDKIYIAGVSVDNIIVDGTTYGYEDFDNLFLIRLSLDGAFEFVNTYPDSSAAEPPYVAGITHNQQNRLYITGSFSGYLDLGPTTLPSNTPTTFICMFDADGNFVGVDKTTSPGSSQSRGWPVTVDADNKLLVGGHFQSSINYSPCNGDISVPSSDRNPYILKTDSALNCEWLVIGDGVQGFSTVYGLLTDADNNVYACGNFNDSITFGGITLHDDNGTFFLVKLDADGNVLWAKGYGSNSTSGQAAASMSFDADGNIWLTGWHASAADFGSISFSGSGVFAVKLDADGNPIEGVEGNGLETSYASLIDNSGNLIITGGALGDEVAFDGDTIVYSDDAATGFFLLRYYLDSDSCSADTTDVSIFDALEQEVFHVFPNPSSGNFELHFNNLNSTEGNIEIYAADGSLMYAEQITVLPGKNDIPVHTHLPKGMYAVTLTINNTSMVSRLIIQ